MYSVDYDSSDEEYMDDAGGNSWSCSFDKIKKNRNYNADENNKELEPVDVERCIVNACINGDLATVQQYYSKENSVFLLKHILVGSLTVLHQAASYSQDHIVQYLLDIGADPNFKADGVTALMCACSSSSVHRIATVECVKQLLDKGALPNVGDRYGVTPLMRAVASNKGDVVRLLVSRGGNLEMRNNVGRTAIFYAVEHKLPDMIKLLIKSRCYLDNQDRRGATILSLARSNDSQDIVDILKQYLPCEEDDEEQEVSSVSDELNWCDMLPYTSVANHKPAYVHEIAGLLRGMNCSRLEPLISRSHLDLPTFLTLDQEGMRAIGVDLPYERRKLEAGIRAFHHHQWKTESVLGLRNVSKIFDPLKSVDIISCHMRNLTVLESSIDYMLSQGGLEGGSSSTTISRKDLHKEIQYAIREVQMLRSHVAKLNGNNLTPADLIVPNNPKSMKSFRQVKILFISVCLATVGSIVTIRFKLYRNISCNSILSYVNKIL